MTNNERIVQLEARIASLEARLVSLEYSGMKYGPVTVPMFGGIDYLKYSPQSATHHIEYDINTWSIPCGDTK